MIDEEMRNSNAAADSGTESGDQEVSKSQRKREADAIRDLGARLAQLSSSELATIDLPDDVLSAVKELCRIKSNSARKRQLGFLAKRLRHVDVDPIDKALENIRQSARANTLSLHQVEHWRDRLLGDVDDESARAALTAFLDEYRHADRQNLKHLQAQALKEREKNRPPAAARQLFKVIRDQVAGGNNDQAL